MVKCPYCLSSRHDTTGGDGLKCLRCKKQYFFEKTDSGKGYRYFSDKEMTDQLLLKDADYEAIDIPPGMWLYGVKHPVTREYRNDIIAVDRYDAIRQTGWGEDPQITSEMPIHTIPIKKGPDPKDVKEQKKKEKGKPILSKPKREGPSLKDEIITFAKSLSPLNKDKFVKGVHKILQIRMSKDGKPIDKDHLLKRSKLYWSMYGKGVNE